MFLLLLPLMGYRNSCAIAVVGLLLLQLFGCFFVVAGIVAVAVVAELF